ncbi:BCL2/adenovirus E1B 19 kDa protein-interacting protein 2 isoform X1 [Scomber scombrus]|uniref:BCL2/adenovirus E1B 19 kDa protein-interacting protein 2 isoform X1 n=1 Tax=Scomber scombrus TaxID=13677 RepID=UPI002DD8D3DB|nr:BCL2/adenovirus E1B 19 kDa protein-interacting protein 2 isoform X1 [Scomber scombrus]
MASDVIESEAVLKAVSDMDLNNSGADFVTPRRTHEELGNRQTSSPSSSGVSGDGDEEELDDLQNSTAFTVENGEEALQESVTKTRGSPQERTTPDNEQEQPGARSSTPVSLPQPSSPPGPSGSLERQESVATTEARLRMEGVELKEEWQDEDFPRPLPEEEELDDELFGGTSEEGDPDYAMNHGKRAKKKLAAPDISLTLDHSEGSLLSDELDESTELDLDDIDTPSDNSNEFEWEDDLPKPKTTEILQKGVESVQEYSASDEREEGRRWRVFRIGDQEHRVDMKAIEPYKRVISHGGYYGDGLNAIIVFAVCFMPESNQPNYRYIMDNLFKYVIGTLELLVAENYMIVYLNGATSRKKMPTVGWLRKCYQQIDRRLRKNLKSLIIVHPSWFIRTLLALTKPFISSKFSQKIKYVYSLTDLAELVPMEYVSIPDCIKQFDDEKNRKSRKRYIHFHPGSVSAHFFAFHQTNKETIHWLSEMHQYTLFHPTFFFNWMICCHILAKINNFLP